MSFLWLIVCGVIDAYLCLCLCRGRGRGLALCLSYLCQASLSVTIPSFPAAFRRCYLESLKAWWTGGCIMQPGLDVNQARRSKVSFEPK